MTEFDKYYKLPITSNYGMFHDANGNHVLDIIDNRFDVPLLRLLNGEDILLSGLPPLSVTYKPTAIFDINDKVISIRGWGRLQKLKDGAKIQDTIGNEIAELINSKRFARAMQ